jgi:imidazolonepropionase-like amidohydrolase
LLITLFVPVVPGAARAQEPPATGVYAIVGAKIEVGDGHVIDKGTVLVRDGLIVAVGTNVTVPPDAEVIKGDGLTVYPGFIDADATQGLQLPEAKPDQDVAPNRTEEASPSMRLANRKGVRPEIHADDVLALSDDLLKSARQAGFTTELLLPGGGTINGCGALVNLSGKPRRDCVVRPDIAVRFTFRSTGGGGFGGGGGGGGYPGSLMGILALTRQTLLDARYHALQEAAFDHGGSRRPPDDAVLAALQPVLAGKIPVVYEADNQNDIHRAVKLADQFGLKLVISGGGEAWKQADELVAHHTPVLLTLDFGLDPTAKPEPATGRPGGGRRRNGGNAGGAAPNGAPPPADAFPAGAPPAGAPPGPPRNGEVAAPPAAANAGPGAPSKPDEPPASEAPPVAQAELHRKWQEKVANAAALDKAGIPFAFCARAVRSRDEFLGNLRKAVKAGLSRQAALRGLTLGAATILGVDRQLGTVAPGKIAALIVMSGDFLDEKTTVKYLLIDRDKFEPGNDAAAPPPAFNPFAAADDEDGP